jgi:hypothetical protein
MNEEEEPFSPYKYSKTTDLELKKLETGTVMHESFSHENSFISAEGKFD